MSTRGSLAIGALLVVWVLALVVMTAAAGRAGTTSECRATVTHPRECVRTVIVGHRAEEGPNENTLAALRHDYVWGSDYETDQWNLVDGTPVVLHDVTLRRTVDPASMPPGVTPDSTPGELTIDQWRALRTFGGEPLPTLYQWLRAAGRWGVGGMVEVKYRPVDPARVARWVTRFGPWVSFYATPHLFRGVCHQDAATELRDVGLRVGLKASRDCPVTLEDARAFGYEYVIASASVLTPAYVREAHGLGLEVGDYLAGRGAWPALVSARVDLLLVPHVGAACRWFGRGRVA